MERFELGVGEVSSAEDRFGTLDTVGQGQAQEDGSYPPTKDKEQNPVDGSDTPDVEEDEPNHVDGADTPDVGEDESSTMDDTDTLIGAERFKIVSVRGLWDEVKQCGIT